MFTLLLTRRGWVGPCLMFAPWAIAWISGHEALFQAAWETVDAVDAKHLTV